MNEPDYRAILKRYMQTVIDDDHIVGLRAITWASTEDRRVLIEVGLETAGPDDDWMWKRFRELPK